MKGRTVAGDRAGLLVRVSSGGQDEANQVPDVERYVTDHGYRTSERSTYVLHDKSAYKGEQQATLDQIVADMRSGHIKVLVVWHSDRIDRRGVLETLAFLKAVKDAGGRVESEQEGLLDEKSLPTIVGAWMNHQKSEHLSRQVQLAHSRIRSNGAFRGREPFGYEITGRKYDKRLVVVESLRPVVAEIFQRVIDGESLRDICTWLDSLRCKHAKTMSKTYAPGDVTPWWPAMLMRLVRHPAYSGRYYVKRQDESGKLVTYVHSCEPIVSRKVHRQAIEALSSREKRGPRGNADARAMLKGVMSCPFCDDSPMYKIMARSGQTRVAYYRCSGRGPQRQGCGNMVPLAVVDDTVCEIMARKFAVPRIELVLIKGHDWGEEIEAVKDQISALGSEDLPDDEYDRRLKELRTERDRLKSLPADPDELRETETDELYSDLFAALSVPERGAWLKSHGFRVTASKAEVTVVQGETTATASLA
jgi:site-specific DNA recombinase